MNGSGASDSAGARWVEQYLRPLLGRLQDSSGKSHLDCLQLEADDEQEARRLRGRGHTCDIVLFDRQRRRQGSWQPTPLLAEGLVLPVESESYDLVFSGYFGRVTASHKNRQALARELARICRPGGAVLLTLGNRLCPVDLSGNAPSLLHGWGCEQLVTFREMEQLFLNECGFSSLEPLSLAHMFSWNRLARVPRFVVSGVDGYLRLISGSGRRWLYAGFLSPMFCLWIRR